MAKPIALSFSKINTYTICPRQFMLQYVTKDYPKDDDNPYFVKGQKLHKQLEDFVIAKLSESDPPRLNKAAQNAIPIVEGIMQSFDEVYPEQKLCINKSYKKIGWFDHDAYFRAIVDFMAKKDTIAVAVDYKSGKVRDYSGFGGQLHLTAMTLFAVVPDLEVVKSAYLYLEHKHTVAKTFTRDEYEEIKRYLDDMYDRINSDKKFEPTQNDYCRFCKADHTQCKYKPKSL